MSDVEVAGQGRDAASVGGDGSAEVSVRVIPGGPLLVRGASSVRDAQGTSHPTTRPVVAVCACGKTQRTPWCDGTHKVVRRER